MLRNKRSSIVDFICHLQWLKSLGSPGHVNESPLMPSEDLIHLFVNTDRDTLDATDDSCHRAVGFRLHACYVKKEKKKKAAAVWTELF